METTTTTTREERGEEEGEWRRFERPLFLLGLASAALAVVSYKKKRTGVFKASYATACVSLGPATVMKAMPERKRVERTLLASKSRGTAAAAAAAAIPTRGEDEDKTRTLTRETMERMRRAHIER
tara:strand:+ start:382 stop:756 length:375 start_codon:yes stop_codon:yes gene_type:complete